MNLSEKQQTWYPRWVDGYAGFHSLRQHWLNGTGELPLDRDLLIAYLRSLRDSGIPAWLRRQAARALEIYQGAVLRHSVVAFRPIRDKRQKNASAEKRNGDGIGVQNQLVKEEGTAGLIDSSEPDAIRRMRERMRFLHHPNRPEQARTGLRRIGRPVHPASR